MKMIIRKKMKMKMETKKKVKMKVKTEEKKRLDIHLRGGLLLSVSGMEETSTGTVFSSSCWRPSTTMVLEWSTAWRSGSTYGILHSGRVPSTSGGAASHCGQLGSYLSTVLSPQDLHPRLRSHPE